MIYFPRRSNIRPIPSEEVEALYRGVSGITRLPWPIWPAENVQWCEDSGMDLDNGVMGMVRFLDRDRILLSPCVVKGLSWENPYSIATAIHELTHRHQMSWCGGLLWPFLNLPGLRYWLLAEKWAMENQMAAQGILGI